MSNLNLVAVALVVVACCCVDAAAQIDGPPDAQVVPVSWHDVLAEAPEEGGDLDLERAIATLSPQARLIFMLHDIEGYKHREIADLTGIAVGTSKAHLHRARRLLRKELST